MIFYLFDFFINNLNLYTSSTILFKVGKYKFNDLLYLLFIDIFINRIPIIFVSILFLNLLNKLIRKKFVNSYVLDNLLFFINYILFFLVLLFFNNSVILIMKSLFNGLLINYFLFLLIHKNKYN